VPFHKRIFPVESFSGFGLHLESRFWSSKKDFLDHAMPVGLMDENGQPAAVCYSAANSSGLAEIDIYTAENYRKKGLGKLATSLFINECIQHDLTPNWDCFAENKGSFNLAICMGFTAVRAYNFLSIFTKNEN
jgi:RimJ/RimL family protein N-acetyltransferase